MSSAKPAANDPGRIAYVGGGMYLGTRTARNIELLQALNIKYVVAIGSTESPYKDDFEKKATAPDVGMEVLPIAIDDVEDEDMLRLYNREEVKAFLTKGTSGGNKTLVHCFVGRSRSVTLIGLHLIASRGLTVLDSLSLILSARLRLQAHDSFIQSMKDLEKQLGKPCSFDKANLPGKERYSSTDQGAGLISANRDFFKQKDNLARVKQLREEDPEPEETKLEIYRSNRFADYEPIPSNA